MLLFFFFNFRLEELRRLLSHPLPLLPAGTDTCQTEERVGAPLGPSVPMGTPSCGTLSPLLTEDGVLPSLPNDRWWQWRAKTPESGYLVPRTSCVSWTPSPFSVLTCDMQTIIAPPSSGHCEDSVS